MSTDHILTKVQCLALAAALLSCVRPEESSPEAPEQENAIAFTITAAPEEDTKSAYYDDTALSRLVSVVIYGVDDTGYWKRLSLRSSDGMSVSGSFRFPAGHRVTFYALGNMGDVTLPVRIGNTLAPDLFVYNIPPDEDLLKTGFPMAGETSIIVEEGMAQLSIPLKRLFAKVEVTIEKEGLTGGATPVLASGHLHLRQASRRLQPFTNSQALRVSDLFDSPFDTHVFTQAEESDLRHVKVCLYVPENYQTSPHLATYIEYQGEKDGSADGVDGTVVYRGLLGPVIRNTLYSARLSLTWDGLMWKADGWTIDTEGVTDGRMLVLSREKDSRSEVSSLGKIQRSGAKDLYVSFSRDGGASWVHGAKDMDNWPFGWDFYIDGVKQEVGENGLAEGAIGWTYAGGAAGDRITVSPGAGATLRSRHTLQVKSADGKVVSNLVPFDVSAPLGLKWDSSVPEFVAQRGRLVATALDDPLAPVEFTVTAGDTRARLALASNPQSAMVNLLGAGEVTVLASCEATGQDEEITFSVKAPELVLESDTYYAHPDGSPAMSDPDGMSGTFISLSYLVNGRIPVIRLASATTTVTGNRLDQDLYDEVLRLVPSVDNPCLEAVSPFGDEFMEVYAKNLSQYPQAGGRILGTLTISAAGAHSGVVPVTAQIRSVNPFAGYPASVSLTKDKDIEDFSAIRVVSGYSQKKFTASLPSRPASPGWYGVSAVRSGESEADDELSGLFLVSGNTVSWDANTEGLTRFKGGTFSLYSYVENRHSHERRVSPLPFYKGRVFVHGAVTARGVRNDDDRQMDVYTDYSGIIAAYTADGLGAAWPDVRTTHTNRAYSIDWAWGQDGMRKHTGSCSIQNAHYTNALRVRNRNELLFEVHDDCWMDHWGHGWEPEWHECRFTGPSTDGSPRLEFMAAPLDRYDLSFPKYNDGIIKYINSTLTFIHPSGSETHTYNGIGGCGFYVMHLKQDIQDRIL